MASKSEGSLLEEINYLTSKYMCEITRNIFKRRLFS